LGLAGAPASQSIAAALPGAKVCILTPQAVEGPFYFDPKLVRADITEGKPGAPLKLTLQVVEAKDCARLEGARVDVWHSDGLGVYSGYARQETGSTRGETFLRGTQFTDADGQVRFATIYPGWYRGRTVHIHLKVHINKLTVLTTQLFMAEDVNDAVFATSPYSDHTGRDTTNDNDSIFDKSGLLTVQKQGDGYLGVINLGVNV